MYINVEIYNVEPCQINVAYFNVDVNNIRQRRNNAVIFNAVFHNIDQRPNNIVNTTIFKKLKRANNIFELQKKNSHLINNTAFGCENKRWPV